MPDDATKTKGAWAMKRREWSSITCMILAVARSVGWPSTSRSCSSLVIISRKRDSADCCPPPAWRAPSPSPDRQLSPRNLDRGMPYWRSLTARLCAKRSNIEEQSALRKEASQPVISSRIHACSRRDPVGRDDGRQVGQGDAYQFLVADANGGR